MLGVPGAVEREARLQDIFNKIINVDFPNMKKLRGNQIQER